MQSPPVLSAVAVRINVPHRMHWTFGTSGGDLASSLMSRTESSDTESSARLSDSGASDSDSKLNWGSPRKVRFIPFRMAARRRIQTGSKMGTSLNRIFVIVSTRRGYHGLGQMERFGAAATKHAMATDAAHASLRRPVATTRSCVSSLRLRRVPE